MIIHLFFFISIIITTITMIDVTMTKMATNLGVIQNNFQLK